MMSPWRTGPSCSTSRQGSTGSGVTSGAIRSAARSPFVMCRVGMERSSSSAVALPCPLRVLGCIVGECCAPRSLVRRGRWMIQIKALARGSGMLAQGLKEEPLRAAERLLHRCGRPAHQQEVDEHVDQTANQRADQEA